MFRRDDEGVIEGLVRRIVEAVQPEKIILFGSAARGEWKPSSDLDLLVIKAGDYHHIEMAQRVYAVLGRRDFAVDVTVATPEEVEKYGDADCLVLYPALREGKVGDQKRVQQRSGTPRHQQAVLGRPVIPSSHGDLPKRIHTGSAPWLAKAGLPRMSGYDVCRKLRAEGSGALILMLTARTPERPPALLQRPWRRQRRGRRLGAGKLPAQDRQVGGPTGTGCGS